MFGFEQSVAFRDMMQKQQKDVQRSRLRDEFAMAALTGLIANSENCEQGMEPTISYLARTQNGSWLAKSAYQIADAMMEARK